MCFSLSAIVKDKHGTDESNEHKEQIDLELICAS